MFEDLIRRLSLERRKGFISQDRNVQSTASYEIQEINESSFNLGTTKNIATRYLTLP